MNSHWLGLHALSLYKIKANRIPAWIRNPLSITLSEEQLMMAHGRKIGFLPGHDPEEAAFALVDSSTPRYIQAAK